jgi:DNA-directed RNA polymerase subunit RPC12/RpoP
MVHNGEKSSLSPFNQKERRRIMSIFSEKFWLAMETGKFICAKCGAEMKFKDKWEDTLVCPKCGHEIDTDLYGIESEEEFEALYPILNPDDEEKPQDKSNEDMK